MFDLYQRVSLNCDFSEYHLKKGDVATLIDYVPHPGCGEEGSVLEIFSIKPPLILIKKLLMQIFC